MSTYVYAVRRCCAKQFVFRWNRVPVLLLLAAVLLLGTRNLGAQSIGSITIVPPVPTMDDEVSIEVMGIHDTVGQPFHSIPWQRENSDILVDVLFLQVPTLAPPIPGPYAEQAHVGMLPVGTYDVTVRTFRAGEFEDPWPFPDVFAAIPGVGPIDTMSTQFTVVPEPSSLLPAVVAITLALLRCRWRGAMPLFGNRLGSTA